VITPPRGTDDRTQLLKRVRAMLYILGAFVLVTFIVQRVVLPAPNVTTLDYKTFYQKLESFQVQTFHAHDLYADGSLTDGKLYSTGIPNRDPAFAKDVVQHVKGTVTFESGSSGSLLTVLLTGFPFLIVAFLVFLIFRTAQRQQPPRS
jgi:ATP-dependent Zn protease